MSEDMRDELDQFQQRIEYKPPEEIKKIELQNTNFVDTLRQMIEEDHSKGSEKKKRNVFNGPNGDLAF